MRIFTTTLLALLTLASQALAAPAVKAITAPGLKAAIAAHTGHVVIVNFWATWCHECKVEFPAIVRTSKKFAPQGVNLITVSADSAKDISAKVIPFLTKHGVTSPQYLQSPDDIDVFTAAFDPTWKTSAYPRTYLYNRQGHRVRVLTDTQTRASLRAALKPLLK